MQVVVGRIGRPHGVRGAVGIDLRTDEPDIRFAVGARLSADDGRQLTVASSTWHSGRLLVTFEGVPDRTAVEGLRGLLLSVERSEDDAPEDPDEFYDTSLIGCQVLDRTGAVVGTVHEVAHLPGQDMLVVRSHDEREYLIPFVEAIVPSVDVVARRILVDPPPGLLDEEAADEEAADEES